jgi:hypothetical protein
VSAIDRCVHRRTRDALQSLSLPAGEAPGQPRLGRVFGRPPISRHVVGLSISVGGADGVHRFVLEPPYAASDSTMAVRCSSCERIGSIPQQPFYYHLGGKNLDRSAKFASGSSKVCHHLQQRSAKVAGVLWFRLVRACRPSSGICARFEFRSWPFGNRNPVPRRHDQRIEVALTLFPCTGNEPVFDQPFSRIADRPWR